MVHRGEVDFSSHTFVTTKIIYQSAGSSGMQFPAAISLPAEHTRAGQITYFAHESPFNSRHQRFPSGSTRRYLQYLLASRQKFQHALWSIEIADIQENKELILLGIAKSSFGSRGTPCGCPDGCPYSHLKKSWFPPRRLRLYKAKQVSKKAPRLSPPWPLCARRPSARLWKLLRVPFCPSGFLPLPAPIHHMWQQTPGHLLSIGNKSSAPLLPGKNRGKTDSAPEQERRNYARRSPSER